jgi:hypothetical protein
MGSRRCASTQSTASGTCSTPPTPNQTRATGSGRAGDGSSGKPSASTPRAHMA